MGRGGQFASPSARGVLKGSPPSVGTVESVAADWGVSPGGLCFGRAAVKSAAYGGLMTAGQGPVDNPAPLPPCWRRSMPPAPSIRSPQGCGRGAPGGVERRLTGSVTPSFASRPRRSGASWHGVVTGVGVRGGTSEIQSPGQHRQGSMPRSLFSGGQLVNVSCGQTGVEAQMRQGAAEI